jgi:hypothetical protein
MVKIGYNLQEKATLIFFIDARLLQGISAKKGCVMKNIWGIVHLLMRFIAPMQIVSTLGYHPLRV